MIISWKWIQEYVSGPLFQWKSPEVMEKVTMRVAEVEEIQETGIYFQHIRVVQILSLRPHPDADQLRLVTFQWGTQDSQQKEVVCGAPNVRVGLKVPYAGIGVTLPGGFVLSAKKIRGVLSEGMLCSRRELGLGEDQSGLMELDETAVVGQTLSDYLQIFPDYLLHIDNKSLTHRPDLWGVWGMAREISLVTGYPLKNMFSESWMQEIQHFWTLAEKKNPTSSTSHHANLDAVLPVCESQTSCLIYYGLQVGNIHLQDIPSWMKERLASVGQRCIHPLVDISNYVMLELGIPLHFFDRKKIQGSQLFIRQAVVGETLTTLDGVERRLESTDTVIADQEGPLVLAGVMGGTRCAVDEQTREIFIEVANWKAASVRKTSSRLGLRTDSSQRYEKNCDSWSCLRTLCRAMELLQQLCPAMTIQSSLKQVGPLADSSYKPLTISTSLLSLSKQLGRPLEEQQVLQLFHGLGLEVKRGQTGLSPDVWNITVPSFRAGKDLTIEADLVEEIGRLVGYDTIPAESPLVETKVTTLSPMKKYGRQISDFFVLHGDAQEVTTYPLIGDSLYQQAMWTPFMTKTTSPIQPLVLMNALSQEQNQMRTSLVPHHMDLFFQNKKHRDHLRFFEIGRCYFPEASTYFREEHVLMVTEASEKESCFMELVDLCDDFFSMLGIKHDWVDDLSLITKDLKEGLLRPHLQWKAAHPHEYLGIRVMGKIIGSLSSLHPHYLRTKKVSGSCAMMTLSLSFLEKPFGKDKVRFQPIAPFPPSMFDCTVLSAKDRSVKEIIKVCQSLKEKEIQSYHVVDIFPLSDQQKSITLRVQLQDPSKTLESERLKTLHHIILTTLEKGGFPLKMS